MTEQPRASAPLTVKAELVLQETFADGNCLTVHVWGGRYVMVGLKGGKTIVMRPDEAGILGEAIADAARRVGREETSRVT